MAESSNLGLRPGFVLDLGEPRPYGAEVGQRWDLSNEMHVKDVHEMIEYEDPILLLGSPPYRDPPRWRKPGGGSRNRRPLGGDGEVVREADWEAQVFLA